MNKVVIINLNGNAYHIEEDGYDALHNYLEQAKKRLKTNPDKEEILSDFEQAIADKCNEYLSAKKTVIKASEMKKIIEQMGPVDGEEESEGETNKDTKESRKKLYQIREGAWISGVCNGLAVYFGIDVMLVRAIFIILTFITHGAGILLYIILMFLIPWAKTPEEKAKARGEKFTADSFFVKASAKYEEFRKKGIIPSSISQEQFVHNWKMLHHTGNRIGAMVIGFIAGIVLWFWIVSLWSIATSGTVFGYGLGNGVSRWLVALFVTAIAYILFWPLKVWIRSTLISAEVYKKEPRPFIEGLGWLVWAVAIIVFVSMSVIYSQALTKDIMSLENVLTHGQKAENFKAKHFYFNTKVK